ncbi:MAG: 3-hydroxyacyl-ACP dehydratase FabZ [Chlamydiia bacterium]|nr:3-hydroxyacyl-ACP dehydratase FabZ [Chlamydiia bacterium]
MTDSDSDPISMDIKEIMKVIPHRYPFLLVDKIVSLDAKNGVILGQKNVTINEDFFQGHFPGAPLMPGVLILEALAQVGAVLVFVKGQEDKIGVLLNIKEAKFRNPVKPGDILMLKCEGIHFSSKGGRVKAMATVNDKVAVEAEIAFALVDKETV